MATLIALTVIILAIVYFRWLLKMCDKDADQREKTKEKTLDGIAFFIAISITIAVVVFVIFLIWVICIFDNQTKSILYGFFELLQKCSKTGNGRSKEDKRLNTL